jgi:transcriptional regulator with XRE-family HTH domain
MPPNSQRITGRQVAGARGLLGLSQEALAEACDVGAYTISSFETGNRTPHARTVDTIRRVLEARGIEFINGRGVMLKKPGQDGPVESESASE